MSYNNDFFRIGDKTSLKVGNHPIHESWWSRIYEYPWAIQFAKRGMVVADMGAGWMGRPFKDMLADVVETVHVVDVDKRILELPKKENIIYHKYDFTETMYDIAPKSCDLVYCISVLEDLEPKSIYFALAQFKELLKGDGKLIITTDVRYDHTKPLGKYSAINFSQFQLTVQALGFVNYGAVAPYEKDKAVFNEEFNLCCYHTVLIKQ